MQLHNGNWVEERYFDVHKIVHLGQIFSQRFIFFWQNTFCVDGDTLWCSFPSWEALTIWSPYSKFPFISRVVDSSREWLIAPPAPQYQTFPVVTQLYFTGSGVHCPSLLCLSYLYRQLAPAPLLPSLAGFILPSVSGSCLGPTLASLPAGTRGCCLRPSRAPSTGGGWPGVFRGIMRLIMSGDSLPRYPCHPEHRARIRLPIKTLSLIRKTNGHELLWKSWYLAFLPNVFVFSPDTNWQQLLWWMWKMGESTVFCNKWNKYLMIVSFPHV